MRSSLIFRKMCPAVPIVLFVLAGLAGIASVAQAPKPPATVYLIRHAEKLPGKEADLSPQGFKRAGYLPLLFNPPAKSGRVALARPDFLFAAQKSRDSNRPIETILPLSQALHLPINHEYQNEYFPELAKLLLSGQYAGKVVLVCWHHGVIPHFARELGATPPYNKWPEDQYDRIWRIDWPAGGGPPTLTDMPQYLMAGDSK